MGRGTQRVEENGARAFPARAIVRIDRDSARRRGELVRTLEGIRRGEGDILVGTQLLAKGHDFPALTLVGVLNADTALVSTDYRAPERLFAVLAQVAGRAGRRERPGEVLIQTRYPGHPLFAALARHDFAGFAEAQLDERAARGFPPFVFEAALRAEAPKLDTAMRFLEACRGRRPRHRTKCACSIRCRMCSRGAARTSSAPSSSCNRGSRPALQEYLSR